MQFDMGYAYIALMLIAITVNVALIVYRTVERWRHNRALLHKRKIFLQQLEMLNLKKESELEKKAAR
jgi:hypothetical protein